MGISCACSCARIISELSDGLSGTVHTCPGIGLLRAEYTVGMFPFFPDSRGAVSALREVALQDRRLGNILYFVLLRHVYAGILLHTGMAGRADHSEDAGWAQAHRRQCGSVCTDYGDCVCDQMTLRTFLDADGTERREGEGSAGSGGSEGCEKRVTFMWSKGDCYMAISF